MTSDSGEVRQVMTDEASIFAVHFILKCHVYPADGEIEPPEIEPLYEERVVLTVADNDEGARTLVEEALESRPETYLNQYGERVSWKVDSWLDVKMLTEREFRDGMEGYYRLLDASEVALLRQSFPGRSE